MPSFMALSDIYMRCRSRKNTCRYFFPCHVTRDNVTCPLDWWGVWLLGWGSRLVAVVTERMSQSHVSVSVDCGLWKCRYLLLHDTWRRTGYQVRTWLVKVSDKSELSTQLLYPQCGAADCVLIFLGAAACTAPKFYIFTEANMCVLSLVQCAAQHRHQTILMWASVGHW